MWNLWQERAKPIVAVIRIDDVNDAVPMAQALVAGGIRLLEITLRTKEGLESINKIKQEVDDAIVGAGTVTRSLEFEQAVEAGSQFIVSPGISSSLFDCARQWGGSYLPGVATASEVMEARSAGFKKQKLFPANAIGGVSLLKSLSGPFSDVSFCPTGGINQNNKSEYLALNNVFAVGGSWIIPEDLVAAKNWEAIQALAIAS